MDKKIIVFYSWQSDLPKETNLNGIRQALRISANEVENSIDNIAIELDEATRNKAGSPNIPLTIFEKISKADIFICDLTTINLSDTKNRKVSNPNVLIELGYAIAELGWERIILLFNKEFGAFPQDLPFDIDRHRTTPFSIKDKNDKSGKSQLSQVLKSALGTIIEQKPLKRADAKKLSPEVKKRNIDLVNLKWCLKYVHIPTLDYFLEEMPSRIIKQIFFYQQGFREVVESNSFHIYEEKLLSLITELNKNWSISLAYGHQYDADRFGNYYKYYTPMDTFQNNKSQEEYNYLLKVREDFIDVFKSFLLYIRSEYLEVDLDKTSKMALENYQKEISEDEINSKK
tara:strand:+ start:5541 stop:6572 length:1032 start_codon:yes stop_codon:yes gene_type:complete